LARRLSDNWCDTKAETEMARCHGGTEFRNVLQLEEDARREAQQAAGLNQQREEAARELQHIHSMLEVC